MQIGAVKRVRLATLPTPLQESRRLAEHLKGPQIFIKRDDLTGLGLGGNKLRKLEYALAEAKSAAATCVVTSGAVQSNHCRLSVAACNTVGLPCHLVLRGEEPDLPTGNTLVDYVLGAASIRYVQERELRERSPDAATATELAVEGLGTMLQSRGERPFLLPNGCKPLHGALGYAQCVREIVMQLHELNLAPDSIITACGGGGTQVGLVLGSELFCAGEVAVLGISAGQPKAIQLGRINAGLREVYAFLECPEPEHRVVVHDQYIGLGYGIPTTETIEAIQTVARLEGVLLDPVYTGKAMAGLMDLIPRCASDSNRVVVFVHTGGTPGLFANSQAGVVWSSPTKASTQC